MKTNAKYLAKLAIDKSLLKEYFTNEYSRTVYMKDGQEFQIQIFNPYNYTIGVDILINNTSLGNTFIIRPGQRVWLERYFDSANKFKFSTYFVHAENEEVKRAIRNNGQVSIKFYKEREPDIDWWKNINKTSWTYYKYPEFTSWTTSASTIDTGNINNCYTQTPSVSLSASAVDNKAMFNAVTSEIPNSAATSASTMSFNKEYRFDNTETGRIEKGNYSKQRFIDVNVDLENYPFAYETIKILPESQKQVNANDLKKLYCHACGHKIKDKFKFCPYCGAKL